MIWIKRLLVLLAGLLFGSVLLLAAAVVFLGESEYKRLLTWGAEHFLDSQLVIEGPLDIDLARDLSLDSGGILLKANDDSYRLSVGELHASFRLGSYLTTGAFWFNGLVLTDVSLDIMETSSGGHELDAIHIPPVVVAQAQVNNLVLAYQELPPGTLHTFALDELTLGKLGEQQPVSLRATGLFEGQPFELEGSAAPLAQLIERGEPHPVQLQLSSVPVNARLQGTIADPLNGRGLDLQIQADIPQLRDIVEIVRDDIPLLGSLRGALSVRGDYTAPRLEEIDLHLQRDAAVDLSVTGTVADTPGGVALDLQLEGQSSNPEVLSWLLFRKHDRMQSVQVSGRVQKDADRFSLQGLDVSAETADGLKLSLKGSTDIHPAGRRLLPADAGLAVQFSTPTLAAANLTGLEGIPEPGPAVGSLRLALGRDALGVYNADVAIGNRDNVRILLKGDVGHVRLTDTPDFSGLKLQADLESVELARVGELFDYPLPELGQTRLRGQLETRGSELLFRDARLEVGAANQPTIRANGRLSTQLSKGSTVNVAFDVAVTDLIAAFRERLPGYLGRLEGEAEISDLDGDWGIERFSLATTRTSLYQLNLSGRYDDLMNYDKASINLDLGIDDPEKLGETIGRNLTGVGRYHTQGLLTVDKGRLNFQGKATLGNTHSTTALRGYLQDDRPVLSGSFEIPVLHLADFGIGSSGKHIADETAGSKPSSPHVFSREPLNTGFLNDFDLDLAISVDEVESDELTIDSIKGKLRLRNGHLSVAPLRLVFEGGNTDISMDVKATDIPQYRLAIIADDLTLGPLLAQIQDDVPIRGYSNLHLDLHARGRSPHDLASSLAGSVSLGLENARIPNHYVKLLAADMFGWVLSKSVSRESHANLNCVVMAFDVTAGKVASNTIIADGPRLSLGGQIDLDLGEETLDIVLIPKQKKRMFSSATPVKIKGPMQDPVVEAIPAKAALQEIGTMALLPGVFIPVRALERLWGLLDDGDKIGDGCANIDEMRAAANNKAPVQDAAGSKAAVPGAEQDQTPQLDWFRE